MFTSMVEGSPGLASGPSLADFLRTRQAEILAKWESRVRQLSIARDLPTKTLVDHLPELLERIAVIAADISAGKDPEPPIYDADRHAHERLEVGFDLAAVVREYGLLRASAIELWEADHGSVAGEPLRILNEAIDFAVAASVDRYTEARNRTLVALDRISSAALESPSADVLLRRLLRVFTETTSAVDTASVFLRRGDLLRVEAAVGLEAEAEAHFSVRIGEGFAGTVAAERKPRFTRCAADDPLVLSPYIRQKRVRALYGVPLIDDDELIGVAQMGSLTAFEFSDEDKRLFRAMVARATSAIQLHSQREAIVARTRDLKLLERLMSVHPDFFYVFDRSKRFTYVSPALLALWGRSHEQAIGRTFAELGYPTELVNLHDRQLDEVLRTGLPVRGANAYTSPAGTTSEYEYIFAPVLSDGGEVQAIAGVTRDITDRKRIEVELERTAEFRERFIGILAHDLRNPLSTMVYAAHSLLQLENSPTAFVRPLHRIVLAGERMERMIRDMVDFARTRLGGGMPVRPEPMNLAEICQTVADELGIAYPDAEIRVEPLGGCTGLWDRDRVLQLVSNLTANALQHGARDRPVTLRTRGQDGRAFVEVHNFGAPIPPESLPYVFEPFRRAIAPDRDPAPQGVGLGLYIVKEIAAAHGGTVEVTSSEREGTTFRVSLPRDA